MHYAPNASSAPARDRYNPRTRRDEDGGRCDDHSESVRYRDGQTPLTGYMAWDDGQNGRGRASWSCTAAPDSTTMPGAALADRGLGYVAFACDMYGDGVAGDRERIMATIADLRADRARLVGRAAAGLDGWPHTRPWTAGSARLATASAA